MIIIALVFGVYVSLLLVVQTNAQVSGKCGGNAATATDLAQASTPAGTFQFDCGQGFALRENPETIVLAGADDAAKKETCCVNNTPFSRPFSNSDDFCSNGVNQYFCSRGCNSYYYCNGKKKGSVLQCPSGTSCNKLGPHKKYADTDAAGATNLFDTWDVTYACQANNAATCWSNRAAGNCENSGGQDQTCSGGGKCRSTSPDCANNPTVRSCRYDSATPEQCQCTTSEGGNPTTFDPTFTNDANAKQNLGISCSIVQPGLRAQCDPPMDVMFVSDASDSITREVSPKCYDPNTFQVTSCDAPTPPVGMISVYDEYAKARNFAKKFMSYFVIAPDAVKLGYVAFTKDVVLTRSNGKQVCANELAAQGTRFNFATDSAVEYDNCNAPFAVSADLQAVLAEDASTAARSIDMKYYQGGTKMFLGMSIARQVLQLNKVPGRTQLVILIADGVDSFSAELLVQANLLKTNGVRIVTIAAGDVVLAARSKGTGPVTSKDPRGALATLRDAATTCTCTSANGSPCLDVACMGPAICVGDCYQATDYQKLVDTVVVDIVRQNCEILTSITPSPICSSPSSTLIAKGAGFGAQKPQDGQIKFKVGQIQFDGIWVSDNEARLPITPWNNQYGTANLWNPVTNPDDEPNLRVQVSIDGGQTWLREQSLDPAGFKVLFKVCEKVDSCAPHDGNSCYDCHEGLNSITIKGRRFGNGPNGDARNDLMVCGFGDIAVTAEWISATEAKCIVPPLNCTFQGGQCSAAAKKDMNSPDGKYI